LFVVEVKEGMFFFVVEVENEMSVCQNEVEFFFVVEVENEMSVCQNEVEYEVEVEVEEEKEILLVGFDRYLESEFSSSAR